MGRLLKVVGIVVGAVLVLLVGALLAISVLIDPNDYKDEIEAAVADATGRTLTLEGDLELNVFPAIAIGVGGATLSNAPGFGNEPFAEIARARLELELWPLFSRRVSVGEAALVGLRLNLARNAAGADNWSDIGAASEPAAAPEPAAEGGGAGVSLDVGAVRINDAAVRYTDAAAGTSWQLADFNFEASGFGPGRAFPAEMSFRVAGDEIEAGIDAAFTATLALDQSVYRLDDVAVSVAGEGAGWPGGRGGSTDLGIDSLRADLDAGTVDLENLVVEMLGLSIRGSLAGRNLATDLTLNGAIDIAPFDPRDLLDAFSVEIETADGSALRQASASAELTYDSTQMSLSGLTLQLDDSELVGSMGLYGEEMRFDLAVDEINVDRYLPPSTDDETPPNEGSVDEVDLPLDVLGNARVRGELDFGRAQFSGLTLTDARFELNVTPGRLRLTPSASLYGGRIEGEVRIDVQGDSAVFATVQSISGIDLAAFGTDYLDSDMFSGTGRIDIDVRATGSNMGQLQRDLDGDASFAFTDGAWEGVDVWYELRRAKAVLERQAVPERPAGEPRTPFSDISASGVVVDGLLTTEDLGATFPFLTLDGAGTVNLLSSELDLEATAAIASTEFVTGDPLMADYAGDSMPLTVGGTLDSPRILPDFAAMVEQRARDAIDEAVEEEREELEDRVRDRLRSLFE